MKLLRALAPPRWLQCLGFGLSCGLALLASPVQAADSTAAERLTIAAAADLRFALADLLQQFAQAQQLSSEQVADVIYGSSGKLSSQLQQGAPYDLFFSADPRFTDQLFLAKVTTSRGTIFARGRLVLWSQTQVVHDLPLSGLTQAKFRHIALAQPQHAPYGERAQQVLQHAGVWQALQPKLVFGENVAQTAQLAKTGAVDAAFIALSLATHPSMTSLKGANYQLIDASWHQPLRQTVAITQRGATKTLAAAFVVYLQSPAARQILQRYGFAPDGAGDAESLMQSAKPSAQSTIPSAHSAWPSAPGAKPSASAAPVRAANKVVF